jgi:CRISPR-associated endonuclease/helicase Cas3
VDEKLLFWAKLGNEIWPQRYHPVVCHLIDVAAVTRCLWDLVIRRRLRHWLSERLGLSECDCGPWLAFWCGAHDVGKVSPCFQDRGANTSLLRKRLEPDFTFATGSKPHGDLGTRVLADELASATRWPMVATSVASRVAVAVGGHHGFFPIGWGDIRSPLGNGRWANSRTEILAELARLCGVVDLPAPTPTDSDDLAVWMYVAGLTSVADWIGSNQEFFPPAGNTAFIDNPFDADAYFEQAVRRAKLALETLGWLGRADTTTPVAFAELFPFIPHMRPLQVAVAGIVADASKPSLTIVEAPMGEGKTEAAWYAAACWDRRGGQGTYVALPTMATSNQMFRRVCEFLKPEAGKQNLMLQHGKAAMNETFVKLKFAATVYDDEGHPSAVVAEGWFAANKKHGLLAPYGVGTIDQALLAVLQTKHVFVRLFGLAGKCVILDEVHAYDAYMTTLMERLLRWLASLGCPVVLLSATLPREKRMALLRAYAGEEVVEPNSTNYPRVTYVDAGGPAVATHVAPDPQRAKTVNLDWVPEVALIERLRSALANGGCAAVIRNTVRSAQDTYERLRDSLNDAGITVELFHARFPFGRRKAIEDEVLDRLGKGQDGAAANPKRPARYVLVATQVIEQSLDLDFDLMVSDVAPVDLVLQRAGRLHRHDRGERPPALATPMLWLIEPEVGEDGVPRFGSSEFVYARFVLLRSLAVLQSGKSIRLPEDLERFVEHVYGSEALAIPPEWEAALKTSEAKLQEARREQRMKAKGVMIYPPDDEDLLGQQNARLDEDNPEAAEKIRAATRDTEPTIQLIVVYHLKGQDYLDPEARVPFDESDEPNLVRVRQLLDNEVSIGHRGCVAHYVRIPVPTGWRKSGMLRNHRVLRVGSDGLSQTDDWIRSTHELGIVILRNADREVG